MVINTTREAPIVRLDEIAQMYFFSDRANNAELINSSMGFIDALSNKMIKSLVVNNV